MKTRLMKAMEANGVSVCDLKHVLKNIVDPHFYDDEMLDGLVREFLYYDESMLIFQSKMIMSIALLCNVSIDYLVGMSDNMNTIG